MPAVVPAECTGSGGGGSGQNQTPWLQDEDADGFDLFDLGAMMFDVGGATLEGQASTIWNSDEGVMLSSPGSTDFEFLVYRGDQTFAGAFSLLSVLLEPADGEASIDLFATDGGAGDGDIYLVAADDSAQIQAFGPSGSIYLQAATVANRLIVGQSGGALLLVGTHVDGSGFIDYQGAPGLLFIQSGGGVQILRAPSEKVAFYGSTPVVQAAAIANPSGGGTQDAESRTAIGSILTTLRDLGLIDT